MKPEKPSTVRLRYVGGLPLTVHFLDTRRTISVEPGEVYDLLPAEAESLRNHPDYQPEEGQQ